MVAALKPIIWSALGRLGLGDGGSEASEFLCDSEGAFRISHLGIIGDAKVEIVDIVRMVKRGDF